MQQETPLSSQKDSIDSDVSGNGVGVDGKDVQDLLRQMDDAFESLDKHVLREYKMATEVVPELVASETPFISFLRTADYVPAEAAKRLALYWKYRNEVFEDRWLLPMTQTGRGALTLPDITLLQSGYLYFQPGNATQKPFVVIDFSRAEKVLTEAEAKGWNRARMGQRATVYCCTVCPDEDSQTRGAILFYPITSKNLSGVGFRRALWDFVRSAAPIKVTKVLVAQSYEPAKQQLLEYLRVQTAAVVGFNSQMPPDQIYADSMTRTVRQLEASGIHRDFTPVSLGGNLCFDTMIADWMRMRISVEDMMDARGTAGSLSTPPVVGASLTRVTKRRDREPDMPEADFCRKRNALYSRRMYHKRKLALLSLNEEVKMWQDRNAAARTEHQRLRELMEQASAVVSAHGWTAGTVHSVSHQMTSAPEAIVPFTMSPSAHQSSLHGVALQAESDPSPVPGFDRDIFDSGFVDVFDIPFESL